MPNSHDFGARMRCRVDSDADSDDDEISDAGEELVDLIDSSSADEAPTPQPATARRGAAAGRRTAAGAEDVLTSAFGKLSVDWLWRVPTANNTSFEFAQNRSCGSSCQSRSAPTNLLLKSVHCGTSGAATGRKRPAATQLTGAGSAAAAAVGGSGAFIDDSDEEDAAAARRKPGVRHADLQL